MANFFQALVFYRIFIARSFKKIVILYVCIPNLSNRNVVSGF